ncbi:MAG: DUF192 domain-containing protein [Tepidisphaeraceae bacterium]
MNAPLRVAMAWMLPCALLSCGCQDSTAPKGPSGLRTLRMRIGSQDFTLEVADTHESREQGLMNRDSMPPDHGMLFVFPADDVRGFWMKSTTIPLDIIYVNASARVVSIHSMRPLDMRSTVSAGPARFAIELNQGMAAKCGVQVGDKLTIPVN